MINRCIGITFVLLTLSMGIKAQNHTARPQDSSITMQDLQPTINYADSDPFYQPLREKSGWALMSSAIIPGAGQAANKKWIRAGAYFLAELVLIGVHVKSFYDAKAEQRKYKKFADNNWSVVTYAKWLVQYHDQNGLDNENPYIDQLENEVSGISASYDPDQDWDNGSLELLRNVERNTPFVYAPGEVGNDFSHVMPDYGSQQYYELISKYYQYGPGWNDFNAQYQLPWDGSAMPDNFFMGSNLAKDFNDSYRLAGNMISLLILNHIVSAFDAYLTVKAKNAKLEASTNFLTPSRAVSFKFHF